MRNRFSKKDLETLDFIQNQMEMVANCDSFGMEDLDEKRKMCDRARELLYEFGMLITRSLPK